VLTTAQVIIDLLQKYEIRATFFTLGYVAEKYPELIEKLKADGHEIASHTYSHPNLKKISEKAFEDDLVRSIDILSKLAGERIRGFRAPYFSIDRTNPWAFGVIKRHCTYDSSIFPVGPHYGLPDAPRHIYTTSPGDPFKEDPNGNFIEIPAATLKLPIIGNWPAAGGFHLRILPLFMIKRAIRKLNDEGHPAMCYIHPEDLAPDRPHLPGYTWHYYYGLKGALRKFESLLKNFEFSSVREVVPLYV
jgi:polysaccharide deacetylase family protein (PEP-CTERM system associated)